MEGRKTGTDRVKEKAPVNQWGFGGVCYCSLPCIVTVADKKKLPVFLKAQEAGVRGESGGERGEEAFGASTQLSDISSQTEKRHLRHSCKTARKQDFCFIVFVLEYSLVYILLLEIVFVLVLHHLTTR